ncbi:MAG: CCA tRNA nucleotidyltransferase [Spirochaetales bacterium]|nr:CCA tRNA nucleotidyltransferase [Candidatus Physcosoma equi]
MTYLVPEKLKELASIFRRNGYSLFLVGGAVRDYILGSENHDFDFTTDAEPMEVKAMFPRTIDTGIKHGTVTVLYKGGSYEITTFRTEGDYSDSRHPDSVKFVRSLDEDLKRRDFTINALAADLFSGEIIGRHRGLEDLKDGIIRAIGKPEERFGEDALRMMRAARFAAKLGFTIESETLKAMATLHENIKAVSEERIHDELFKLIGSPSPRVGLEALRTTGLMAMILPELEKCYDCSQDGYHNETVYEHQILALEKATKEHYPMEVKIAALFHDLGKVQTKKEGDGHFTYYGHELVSEKLVKQILTRLKSSNQTRDDVALLVREHMFAYSSEWSDGAVRRFMNRVGLSYLEMLFQLRECDKAGTTGALPDSSTEEAELKARIQAEMEKNAALSLKDLLVNGKDMMALGLKGQAIGKTLNALLDIVIENPEENTKETLLQKAREINSL